MMHAQTPPPTLPGPAADVAETPGGSKARGWVVAGRRVFMLGVGGCGMSGLARMLRSLGAVVSGSDMQRSSVTAGLVAEGIPVGLDPSAGGSGEALPESVDLVIASAAVKADHPGMLEAVRRGVETMVYAEALGRCMLGRTGVAVAGTHGKSTTSAMLTAALVDAGLDPTAIVGATSPQLAKGAIRGRDPVSTGFRLGATMIPSGAHAGKPGVLIAEACEFNRSFHNLHPTIGSISAVEADHLDVYGSLDAVVEAFAGFARLLPAAEEGGKLIIAHDGAHRRDVTAGVRCAVETIGYSPEADWVVGFEPTTRRVTLYHERKTVASWVQRMPGAHNAMNAATACALAVSLGADAETVGRSLGAFEGLDRRVQLLGERAVPGGAVRVWDDYGHHPTEIDATLRALRDFERPEAKGGRLICVFQPHQHSRTRFLLEEFASAFEQADAVVVPHIYFVRDSQAEKQKVSAADLVDRLRTRGVRAMHLYPFEAIVEQLENLCRAGDTLVVMGAGPVWQVAHAYLGKASGLGPEEAPGTGHRAPDQNDASPLVPDPERAS